jgi:putative YhbY family RNA-binding protein
MKILTPDERRALRARAHALHPVVSISSGNGFTDTVRREIDRSLTAHELIKVRLYGIERAEREAMLALIAEALDAAPVQHIGNVLVLYRERPADAVAAPPPAPRARRPAAAAANPRRRLAARRP